MSKGLKNFFIICVCVLGAGVIFTVAGLAMGGVKNINKLADEYNWGCYVNTDTNMIPMHLEDGATFDSIDLSGPMDVRIMSGSEKTYIKYDPDTCTPQLTVEGNVLKAYSNYNQDEGVVDLDFARDNAPVLYIYIPEGTVLNSINGDIDYGDIDIKGITTNSINISANLGDIEIDGVSATNITLTADMGDIEINMPLSEDNYTVTANISAGDLSVNNRDYDGFDRKYSAGSGPNVINLSADMGDIEIDFAGAGYDD